MTTTTSSMAAPESDPVGDRASEERVGLPVAPRPGTGAQPGVGPRPSRLPDRWEQL